MKTTGGAWSPADRYTYFLASKPSDFRRTKVPHPHILFAVNAIGPTTEPVFEETVELGYSVLLDSGIFELAMEHAKAHGLSHNAALNLAPDQVDGFEALWERYLRIVNKHGERMWGYIELDLGGADNKRKTRARLEALGLRPIPVYHPFGDGWDYFDELAEQYDRICLGNIVQAKPDVRQRLIATIVERKRKYPGLWIHALGMTPNPLLNALPVESCDSSSWYSVVRWDGYKERVALQTFSNLPRHFQYEVGDEAGWDKSLALAAVGVRAWQSGWREHLAALDREGLR